MSQCNAHKISFLIKLLVVKSLLSSSVYSLLCACLYACMFVNVVQYHYGEKTMNLKNRQCCWEHDKGSNSERAIEYSGQTELQYVRACVYVCV